MFCANKVYEVSHGLKWKYKIVILTREPKINISKLNLKFLNPEFNP